MATVLINSAVMPEGAYGTYAYEPATVDDLRAAIEAGAESFIGYAATADQIRNWTGYRPRVRRATYQLAPGDEAIVVRLRYRVPDPRQKREWTPGPDDWEIARLRRVA